MLMLALKTHKYTIDPVLMKDKMYWRVWNDAYKHCGFASLADKRYDQK